MFYPHQPWYIQNFEAQLVQNYRIVCQAVIELTHLVNTLNDKISKLAPTQKSRGDSDVGQQSDDHGKSLTCKFCDEAFEEHWKLEIHTREHEEAEQFTGDICAKTSVAKWRLKKHRENHYRKNVKLCKYFKKEQLCPYEEVGCKFSHKTTNNTNNKSRKCASENGDKVHLDCMYVCQLVNREFSNSERSSIK